LNRFLRIRIRFRITADDNETTVMIGIISIKVILILPKVIVLATKVSLFIVSIWLKREGVNPPSLR